MVVTNKGVDQPQRPMYITKGKRQRLFAWNGNKVAAPAMRVPVALALENRPLEVVSADFLASCNLTQDSSSENINALLMLFVRC